MSGRPHPVIFDPLFVGKPWGGRRLAELLGKRLPPAAAIGESWELSDLPGRESRVATGPLAGRTLHDLVEAWGPGLLGGASATAAGRFPLLCKFLDASAALSVQVHPKPLDADSADAPGVKHEAWFVVAAEPNTELFIGLKPGVSVGDVASAAGSATVVDLLKRWPARPGRCYHLPSGTLHALGAGVVVAEVQTPSDATYRLYDWDRRDEQGAPRALHVEECLANIRFDVSTEEIAPRASHVAGPFATVTRLVRCPQFMLDRVRFVAGLTQMLPFAEMAIWMVLKGAGRLARDDGDAVVFTRGDTLLIPADAADVRLTVHDDTDLLEVKVPIASPLAGLPHPPAESAPRAGGLVQLSKGGSPLAPDAE